MTEGTEIPHIDEPEDLGTGSAGPQALTEQPDLAFEHKAEARWVDDAFGLRLLAVSLVHLKRMGTRPPVPWLAIGVTSALAVAGVACLVALVRLVT